MRTLLVLVVLTLAIGRISAAKHRRHACPNPVSSGPHALHRVRIVLQQLIRSSIDDVPGYVNGKGFFFFDPNNRNASVCLRSYGQLVNSSFELTDWNARVNPASLSVNSSWDETLFFFSGTWRKAKKASNGNPPAWRYRGSLVISQLQAGALFNSSFFVLVCVGCSGGTTGSGVGGGYFYSPL